jgi:hypothetical protein
MANEEHVAILERGIDAWNQWRKEQPEITPDLSGANLSGKDYARYSDSGPFGINFDRVDLHDAKIRDANFFDSYMRFANLAGADLCNSQLHICNLIGANLSQSHCGETDFENAILMQANLTRADLDSTNFTGALLRECDFSGAVMQRAIFGENDLSDALHLDLVKHRAPSIVGVDTIYASKGRISETFLRGCGVPENLIRYIPSLANSEDGIQFYSCFISYSSKDEEFAKRLHGRMRDVHLRVWFAPEDIQGGRKLHDQIETAIRVYDKLLIVLSEASLQSEWVMDELRKGFKAERDRGKRKLFPVRLTDYETLRRWVSRDSLTGKDLAEEVRQYFIPDFSRWKEHDQFESAFSRLLHDLRTEDEGD